MNLHTGSVLFGSWLERYSYAGINSTVKHSHSVRVLVLLRVLGFVLAMKV